MQKLTQLAHPSQRRTLCAALVAIACAGEAMAQTTTPPRDGPVRPPAVEPSQPSLVLGPQDLVLHQSGATGSVITADQDQPEEGSAKLNAYVRQTASHSLVNLIQTATAATALVQQAGSGYEVRLEQRNGLLDNFPASTPASTLLNQVGSAGILGIGLGFSGRNISIVTQGVAAVFEEAPDSVGTGLAPRENGYVNLRQTGDRNRARVNQMAGGASTITINQTNGSTGHALYVEQSGSNNKFSVFIDGAIGGSIKMRQSGLNNVAMLDSENEGNRIDARQSGADSFMELSQLAFADVSLMTVNQDCIGNCSIEATQAANTELNAVQLNSLNTSMVVDQFANGGFMDVRQINSTDSSISAIQH
ncbi:MAG: hypothetical protein Q7J29_13370 [Stagnimonas sp.]|nr:hypothetical protein [Stagnimonas sp.]